MSQNKFVWPVPRLGGRLLTNGSCQANKSRREKKKVDESLPVKITGSTS